MTDIEKEQIIKLKIAQCELSKIIELSKKECAMQFNFHTLFIPQKIKERVEMFDKQFRLAVVDRMGRDSLVSPQLYVHEQEIYPERIGNMTMLDGELDFINYLMKPVQAWAKKQNEIYDGIKNNVSIILATESTLKKVDSTFVDSNLTLDENIWPKDDPKTNKEFVIIVKKCESYLTKIDQNKKTNTKTF